MSTRLENLLNGEVLWEERRDNKCGMGGDLFWGSDFNWRSALADLMENEDMKESQISDLLVMEVDHKFNR